MLLLKETHQKQSALSNYCRGAEFPAGIDALNTVRAKEYQRLVRNIFDDTLSSAFPLTNALLTPKEWKSALNNFMLNHDCVSPQVWSMPHEFYEYVSVNEKELNLRYRHLSELMQFEWLELEVYMMADEEQLGIFKDNCNLNSDSFVLNSEIRITAYEFPVHLKNAKLISISDKAQYFVAIHRHPENGKVLFTNLKAPHLQALHYISENESASIKDLLPIFLPFGNEDDALKALQIFVESSVANKLLLTK